MDSYNLLHH